MKQRVLLIDDTRDEGSPEVNRRVDVIARNYWEGYKQLELNGSWDLVLLDHDLNSYDKDGIEFTGYDLICDIERMINNSQVERPNKIEWVSSNPPGRARIEVVIKKLYGL